MQRSFLLLPSCFRIFCCHFCLGSKRNTNKSQKMSTSPEDTRLSCLRIWAWDFPWLFCFSLFPEFLNFVLYSYGVSHDFYDNLRDRCQRKMAFSGTAAHGNSPSLNHPFGFYSWSLPSQNQLRDKNVPNVPNTMKNETVANIYDIYSEKNLRKIMQCRQD